MDRDDLLEEWETGLRDVGPWSVAKNDIVDSYAGAYTKIVRRNFKEVWFVDAFAGDPINLNRRTLLQVHGSSSRALRVDPGFTHHHFIDIDPVSVSRLQDSFGSRGDVTIHEGDTNAMIRRHIAPYLAYETFRRCLALLDPYGMNLEWETVCALGATRTTEVVINFPTMGINRNAVRIDRSKVSPASERRMTLWWGDESWKADSYGARQYQLWESDTRDYKTIDNRTLVRLYCARLKKYAGFNYVAEPLPMRNSKGRVLYYLVFASPNDLGAKIMGDIFRKYLRERT